MTEIVRKKRTRRAPEAARAEILDMTERLMVDEGYAAISSRRVAQELGLNAATIHYYYPTTDDLFVALHRRMTDRQIEALAKVMAEADPIRAYWRFQSGWSQTALGVEFLSLSNHRKGLREKLASATNEAREASARAIEAAMGGIEVGGKNVPAEVVATLLVAIGRLLANEERVGISHGHEGVRQFMDSVLARIVPRD